MFYQIFGQDFGQTEQQQQQQGRKRQRGARASRARPFVVAVNAVVSAVLFDQNLDQKIVPGWPGLAWVKPWAGPASPGLGPGQVLGKLTHLSFFSPGCFKKVHF